MVGNNMNKSIIKFLFILLGSTANAETFNYDYIQARIGTTSSTAIDELYTVEISKGIYKNIAQFTAEVIFHKGVTSSTDFLVHLGYSNTDGKSTYLTNNFTGKTITSSYAYNNIEHFGASLGIRQILGESFEAEIHYAGIKANANSDPTLNQIHLSLMKNLSNKLSIGVNRRWNTNQSDFNQSELVIRRNF
jgi:hypothetical protein